MPFDLIAAQRLCLAEILVLACLGLIFGSTDLRRPNLSERWNTVMAARFPRNERPSRLPALPRGLFFSLLLVGFGVLKCRGFFGEQPLFVACLISCVLSSGVWLLVASGIQGSADYERARNIDAFLADSNAPVPPPVHGLDAPPRWLRMWKVVNVVVFVLLIASLVRSLVVLLPAS